MKENHLPLELFKSSGIVMGHTFRSAESPEMNNTALHVARSKNDALANREAIAAKTLPLDRWVLADQKHTATIRRVDKSDASKGAFESGSAIEACDGLYTTTPDLLLGVFTADCIGMLLYDEKLPLAAAVHSGWKGTVQGILHALLSELSAQNLLFPERLHIRFSPSLSKESFEVGPEVVELFLAMAERFHLSIDDLIRPGKGDRFYIDHQQVQARVLASFGVPAENLIFSTLDTKTNPDCFSYRRDGQACGEHLSLIYIEQTDSNNRQN